MAGNTAGPENPVKKDPDEGLNKSTLQEWVSIFEDILKDDAGWLSGLKKTSGSKKAVTALASVIGTLATGLGLTWLSTDPTLQVTISGVALAVTGLITGVYLHSQGKSDGPGGKETIKEASKEALKKTLLSAAVVRLSENK